MRCFYSLARCRKTADKNCWNGPLTIAGRVSAVELLLKSIRVSITLSRRTTAPQTSWDEASKKKENQTFDVSASDATIAVVQNSLSTRHHDGTSVSAWRYCHWSITSTAATGQRQLTGASFVVPDEWITTDDEVDLVADSLNNERNNLATVEVFCTYLVHLYK